MSVVIPIGANASGAVSAIDQVREALQRAGQEGRRLQDIDLSHPELGRVAGDLAQMQQNLENLLQLGRGGTATAARHMDRVGTNTWQQWVDRQDQSWERAYPDPAERNRVRDRSQNYVTSGTSLSPNAVNGGGGASGAPPPPAAAPPPPPPPAPLTATGAPPGPVRTRTPTSGDSEEEGPGLLSAGLGLLKGPAGMLMGLAGISGIKNMVGSAFSAASSESSSNDVLMRHMGDMSVDFDQLRDSVRKASEGLGLTYQQSQALALSYERQGANMNRETSGEQVQFTNFMVRMAAGMGRSTGVDAGTMMGGFAKADAAGIDPRAFAGMIADASTQGGMSGKVESVMDSVNSFVAASNRALPKGDMTGMAERFLGMFTSMNASGASGLHGANAAALLGTLDQSVRGGGGGGMASTALNYRAFARNGVTDPYKMLFSQEEGMFGMAGGRTLFEAQKGEIDRQYQGRDPMERLHAMSRHFGITMHQAQALDGLRPSDMKRTSAGITRLGLSSENLTPDAYTDIAKVLNPDADLEANRTKMLGRSDVTAEEKERIKGANGEGLRDEIVKALGAHGMEKTEATRFQDASASMTNSITALGTHLIEPLTAIKDILTKVLGAVEIAAKWFTTAGNGPGLARPGAGAAGTGTDGVVAPEGLPGVSNGAMAMTIAYRMGAGGMGGFRLAGAGGAGMGRGMGGGGGDMSGGGAVAHLPDGVAASRSQQAFDYFRSQGWTAEQASGIVASTFQESGMRTDADGDKHRSGGIGQWNGSRRAAFASQYGHDVRQGSFAEQLAFMQWELTHSEKGAGDMIRRQTTARGAGGAHSRYFERPQDVEGNVAVRGNMAEQMLPGFRAHEGQSGASGPSTDDTGRVMHIMAHTGANGAGGAAVQHQIAPLRVIHEDKRGNTLRSESLPVQAVDGPRPYGREFAT